MPPSPYPLPLRGRGDFEFSYARGFAPCIPGVGRDAALAVPRRSGSQGGLLFFLLASVGVDVARRGARRLGLSAAPAFSLLSCPPSPKGKDIPPTRARRALFPSGEGGIFSFLMQGASPLASPGLSQKRHWLSLRSKCPARDVPSLSPANPVFGLLFCPHPPNPLPLRGRGDF